MQNRRKILWITETAVMLALLIALQAVTKPMGQLVTGSCVNAVLALTVLLLGMGSGIAVALLSPVFAFLLQIAPNLVTVPAIMLGNLCYVVLLRLITGGRVTPLWKTGAAWLGASVAKFAVLYLTVVKLICGTLAPSLLGKKVGDTVLLAPPMLAPDKLPEMFSWIQLGTALIGGALAIAIWPLLKKALKK